MSRKTIYALAIISLIIITSGCISEEPVVPESTGGQCLAPKKMIGDICCYDQNSNDICDMDEAGCPDSCDDGNACTNDSCSAETDFECAHEMIYPCCGNDVCDKSEDVMNECPADCDTLDITDFRLSGEKAYMSDDTFQFIHTVSSEPMKYFYLNITARKQVLEDIRYIFSCNSTQNAEIDSIDSESTEWEDEDDQKVNMFSDDNYLIYTNFRIKNTGEYTRDVEELDIGETAYFNFRIEKIDPQKRDDLTCIVKLYFLSPQKVIHKWLDIAYI